MNCLFVLASPCMVHDLRRSDESKEDLMRKYELEIAKLRKDRVHAYCSCQTRLQAMLKLGQRLATSMC